MLFKISVVEWPAIGNYFHTFGFCGHNICSNVAKRILGFRNFKGAQVESEILNDLLIKKTRFGYK